MKTRSELKHEAIMAAAKQTFLDIGVQQTSMDKIAEVAQVSKRTVYNHFESKETLVMALLAEQWQQAIDHRVIESFTNESIFEQLTRILICEIQILGHPEYIELSKMAFGHYLYQTEKLLEQAHRFQLEDTALFHWLTSQKQNKTLDIDNIEFAAEQLHSLIKGQCFWLQMVGLKPALTQTEIARLAFESAQMFIKRYAT